MDDRIRLAEAMNLDYVAHGDEIYLRQGFGKPMVPWLPETDANDDYAVRDYFMASDKAADFVRALIRIIADRESGGRPYVFHVAHIAKGDYARAALKVIDDDKYNTSKYGPGHDID